MFLLSAMSQDPDFLHQKDLCDSEKFKKELENSKLI